MSGKWIKQLAAAGSLLFAFSLGVLGNKFSNLDAWWVLLLCGVTLAVVLAAWVKGRRQVAPVVRFVFYAASVLTVVGVVLSVSSWSPVLQRAGAIVATCCLLVLGLITQGVDQAARRLTVVATFFLGVSCAASAFQTNDGEVRKFLLIFAVVLLGAAWAGLSVDLNGPASTYVLLFLALAAYWVMPLRKDGPWGAAVVLIGCATAGLLSQERRLRLLVGIFGLCGAVLAYTLTRGQPVVLNSALAGMAVAAVGWAFATRRGRDGLALAALVVFAVCVVVAGGFMAWSTTLGLGGAYLAMAVAVLLHGVLVWLPSLPAARARWGYFLNGADDEPAALEGNQPGTP
ncbi:hypothetical protein [Lentzea aerocolonigenes]|uniref:hypothetical protein n=1 Tax=Lentzea aerocolonigenes TaxID=68170 RepID=UPI0004C39674|nr:hypothetical protein [Lentzea aerocolonigenes]MCP2245584.1 hypothetical protein [Lentzea aerocolonigenes]